MNVLLTGSNGMIGRRIYDILSKSYKVIRIDKSKADYCIDISRYDEFSEMIKSEKNFDVIVHCAASISFKEFDENTISTNIIGTMNMAKLALETKCQYLLYLSSIPIIGKPKGKIISTDTKDDPKSLYHISKLSGEYILNLYSDQLKIGILRIASPVDLDMAKSRMIPFFLQKALNNENIKLNGKGRRVQTYINTKDLGNCIKLMIEKKIEGTHLLDGEIYSNIEIAEMCINMTNSHSKIELDSFEIDEDMERWIVSDSFRKQCLNYKLKFPLSDLLKEMIDNK